MVQELRKVSRALQNDDIVRQLGSVNNKVHSSNLDVQTPVIYPRKRANQYTINDILKLLPLEEH